MKKLWIAVGMAICAVLPTHALEKEKNAENDKKKGEAVITVFSDFHSGFGSANDDRGFGLDRAYVGYQYSLGHGLQIKGVIDFGRSEDVDDYHRVGYIKNAQISWKHDKWTLSGGLIGTTQFKVQESFWGKRYIMKSFQDEYKFGSSADLGVSAAYRFNRYVSADVILVNGEGYKKVQIEDGLQYGAGITVTPLKGLSLRVYGSLNEAAEDGKKDKANIAAFVGYKAKRFAAGAEYNYMTNASYTDNQDQSGTSLYASVELNKHIGLFGRWDYLTSKNDWNKANDGNAGIMGAEFRLGRYVKLSPNFRVWAPKVDGESNRWYGYLSASFSL